LVDADRLGDSLAKAEQLQKFIGKNRQISFGFLFKKSIYLSVKTVFDDIVERDLIFHQVQKREYVSFFSFLLSFFFFFKQKKPRHSMILLTIVFLDQRTFQFSWLLFDFR
jgi:hypothetical protein